ncbi:LytR/AlgR family response regulator transcription factor [Sphingobacterium puteale]|uniref:LytR/AlgR family response regulator transcription factor n=1 Tax=Sphingobacterium puteale TaxID=2420510 RepID=UPI003D984116
MPKYSIVVIDDHKADSQKVVEQILKLREVDHMGNFEDIKVFNKGKEGLNYLLRNKVDILFLDIEMPDISGMELYRILPAELQPALVFVTAHSQFAVESYRYDACDYLMKEVSFEAVFHALNKCLKRLGMPVIVAPELQRDYYTFEIKNLRKKRILFFKNIIYMQCIDNYVEITTRGERLTARVTMEEIEQNMPVSYCVRIHRGFIVNLNFVREISGKYVYLTEGTAEGLPIGRSRRKSIAGLTRERR